jgi:hypothetical protein
MLSAVDFARMLAAAIPHHKKHHQLAKFLLQPFHMPTLLRILKWFKHWKFMRDLLRREYNSSCGTAFVAWQARAVCVAPISPVSADYHGPWVYGSSHMEVVHVHTHAQ